MAMAAKKSYLLDMDGVLVRGRTPIPGAQEFLARLVETDTRFLILTNNPMYTPRDLQHRLAGEGLEVPEAQPLHLGDGHRPIPGAATAARHRLCHRRARPGEALHEVGYVLTSVHPDYVVLGETNYYNFDQVTQAIRLVAAGARFIATNPDPSGPTEAGSFPPAARWPP